MAGERMGLGEIVIISGKGGTGKTTLTASLVPWFDMPVMADCDVDAPDLDILLDPEILETESISASNKAVINERACINCGKCYSICHFSAVKPGEKTYVIEPLKCEGCKACTLVCPVHAIDIVPYHTGELFVSETKFGPMIHARLSPGEEVSGRLVSLVREKAREKAKEKERETILIDGPPGVACNVISAITGTDLALLVTEPTISGFHDMKRVYETACKVNVKCALIINKAGLSSKYEELIEIYCDENDLPLLGKVPLSQDVRRSTNRLEIASLSLPDYPEKDFWASLVEKILNIL